MTLKLAYARVSTDKEEGKEQTLEQQFEKIATYGVAPENVYSEKISGSINLDSGKQWLALKQRAVENDETVEIVLVDWSRLSREFYGFLAVVSALAKSNVVFTILGDLKYQQFAPKDSTDGLMLAIEAFGAQLFRERISKATKAKLDYLKGQGVQLGRPEKLTDVDHAMIRQLRSQGFGADRISAALTKSRVASVAKTTFANDADRARALRHARISKSLIVLALRDLTPIS